jgi:hypothetical protein
MFYDAHYLFPRPWTQEQAAPGVPNPAYVALYGNNQLSQPFTAAADQLGMVELWLAGPAKTAVLLTLTTPSQSYQSQTHLSHATAGVYYRFVLPTPLADSADQPFTLTVSAPTATADHPVVVRAVGGDRLGGAVRLNEYNRPGNLDLYSYSGGTMGRWWLAALGEQLLPALFRLRLQQFKPAPLKGNLFAGLLLLLAGLTAVYLFLARPNLRRLLAAAGWSLTALLTLFLGWQLVNGRLQLPWLTPTIPLQPVADVEASDWLSSAPRLVTDLSLVLWTAEREPEARFVSTDFADGRPIIRVPAESRLAFALTLPQNGRFQTSVQPGDATYELRWNDQPIASITGQSDAALGVDLAPWAGQAGVLSLHTHGETGAAWIQPQLLATTDWLLPDATAAQHQTAFAFDEGVRLLGVTADAASPGGVALVRLFWQIDQPTKRVATVFVHLLGADGELLAQHDGQPVGGSYPLPVWPAGVVVADDHPLFLPADLSPGTYTLAVGLYDPTDFARWSVRDGAGQPLPDDRGLIETAVSVNVPP